MNSKHEKLDVDLLRNLQIVDEVLAQLKAPPILANNDFDVAIVHDGYLRATLKPLTSRIPLVIEVARLEVQIHIDRIVEARWWDKEYLKNREPEIQRDIQILLSNSLNVTRKIGFEKIEAMNPSGKCLLTVRRFIGLQSILSFLPITRRFCYPDG